MQEDHNDDPSPAKAPHDTAAPANFIRFMLAGWRADASPAPDALPNHAALRARRESLVARFPGEKLVIPTGVEKVRANDTFYRFRPGSDFFWLTGNLEPDCVMILGGGEETLFVEPNTRDDERFFTDRQRGELWAGRRLGVEGSRVRHGIRSARSLRDLGASLGELKDQKVRVLRGLDPIVDASLPASDADAELAAAVSELRLCKDAEEIRQLEVVVDATKRGFEDVIRRLPKLRSEREVEATFHYRARTDGNDVGYGTIAASGPNACILHWTRNDAPLEARELLLLDAGVEGTSLYTADITRTLPIGGRFSAAQRRIYDLVHRAQLAAMASVRPGVDFMAPNAVAMKILAQGLEDLGILRVSAAEALKEENQFYRRYSLHNISHMLGLDVHDCAKARAEVYKLGPLKPGMVLTIEPGLYFQPDDLTVPEEYRGIGVRIEDDIVVTENGYRNLSAAIPSEATAVEAWMRQVQAPA
jgi:Xaa-Pro aminopeptidase